ncbi:MAG: hypothetical protein OXU20_08935 [Myxococcales bacterium]|nr:hypothetical protein [Myxococcales bacterium]
MVELAVWNRPNCILFALLTIPTVAVAAPPQPTAPNGEHWVGDVGMTSEQLAILRTQLAGSNRDTRQQALQQLSHLSADSLPAIRTRLQLRRGQALELQRAREAITGFRHAVGSRRADDDVDIEPGVALVLMQQRGTVTVTMAETLLLLRSLERIRTREAGLLMALFVDMDDGLWMNELRRARRRAGLWMLPALLELRSHEQAEVKQWARRGISALNMDDPKRATSVADHHLAAAVVRAYASPLDFEAMPVLVRLVAADETQVREAARWAVSEFGQNAIWQLRELYEELTGQQADKSWKWERTAHELYTFIDRKRIEVASTAFAEGMRHYLEGDLSKMAARFDVALRTYPLASERADMAVGYAALGDDRMAHDDLVTAEHAYQRAHRLTDSAEARKRYAARLWFARSERAVSAGVVDLAGYDKALALDPTLAGAWHARNVLDGTKRRQERQQRRWAAAGALAFTLALLWLLIRVPSSDAIRDEAKREPKQGCEGSADAIA